MVFSRFSLHVAARATAIGILAAALFHVVFVRHQAVTALVLAAVIGVIVWDLARYVTRTDRVLARFRSGVQVRDVEVPASDGADALPHLGEALREVRDELATAGARAQSQIDYLRALLDTVPAALWVIAPGHSVQPVNRVAQAQPADDAMVAAMTALTPGERKVLQLGDAGRYLAVVTQFSTEGASRRLVSLHNIGSELDAAEIRAWQDLTRILAHEMMNSLTPIASLAGSMRGLMQADQIDLIAASDVIAQRSHGLMRFVERYRQIADMPRAAMRDVQVPDLFAALERLLGSECAGRDIALSLEISPPDLILNADPDLIEQALINLIRNAMDAVEGVERGSIRLSGTRHDGQIILAVSDNGAGVSSDVLERIFVPFFTTRSGGSGIGLSLVRQVAAAHSGSVTAQARPEGGMVFTLILPDSRQ